MQEKLLSQNAIRVQGRKVASLEAESAARQAELSDQVEETNYIERYAKQSESSAAQALKRANNRNKKLALELEVSQRELEVSQRELEASQRSLVQKETELNASQLSVDFRIAEACKPLQAAHVATILESNLKLEEHLTTITLLQARQAEQAQRAAEEHATLIAELGLAHSKIHELERSVAEAKPVLASVERQKQTIQMLTKSALGEATFSSKTCKKQQVELWSSAVSNLLSSIGLNDQQKAAVVGKLYYQNQQHTLQATPDSERSSRYLNKKFETCVRETFGLDHSKIHSGYLQSLDLDDVNSLLGDQYKNIRRTAMNDYVVALQEHWSLPRLLQWKSDNTISRPIYRDLKEVLTRRWDDEQACLVPWEYEGVPTPSMGGRYRFDQIRDSLEQEFGFKMSLDGISASLDLNKRLSSTIADSVRDSFFTQTEASESGFVDVLDKNQLVPVWCVQIDACRIHKGMSQTAIAFTVVNGTDQPNSLKATKEVAVYEASDKWASLKRHAQPTLDDINELLRTAIVRLEAGNCTVRGIGCGDQALIHAITAQSGCNSTHPCGYCEAGKASLYEKNVPKFVHSEKHNKMVDKSAFRQRSLHRLRLLAHRAEGTCPGCKMKITKETLADPSTKPVFHTGYRHTNKKAAEGELDKWAEIHRGVVYGQEPLVNFEPQEWCPCILHLNLCIVGALHKQTVMPEVGIRDKHVKTKADGNDSGSMSERLYKLFWERGLYIKKIRKPSKTKRLYYSSVNKTSFHGKQAELYLSIFPEVLRLIFPVDMCDPTHADYDKDTAEKFADYMKLWEDYKAIWKLLNDVKTFASKTAKADKLQEMVDPWMNLFMAKFPLTRYLYPHILQSHIRPTSLGGYQWTLRTFRHRV